MHSEFDYLTCGSCQAEFPLSHIVTFMQHKKYNCDDSQGTLLLPAATYRYTCYSCPKKFGAAISLLQHAQYQHEICIFADEPNVRKHSIVSENASDISLSDLVTLDSSVKNQDAIITVPLDKCCTSVVPKKRKRHIETKHNWRHSQMMSSGDIYIDVDNSGMGNAEVLPISDIATSDKQEVLLTPGSTYTIPISGVSVASGPLITAHYSQSNTGNVSTEVVQSASNITEMITEQSETKITEKLENRASTESGSIRLSKKKYPTSKPFKCDECGNTFNQRIHLKKHLSKHTGVKPYKCGQCDYATVERSHLKVHIRIHTGEKPYKCGHCEYATAQNSTLKIHLKRHHAGGLLLECSHCGKSFPEKQELFKHKKEHGDDENQTISMSASAADNVENPVKRELFKHKKEHGDDENQTISMSASVADNVENPVVQSTNHAG